MDVVELQQPVSPSTGNPSVIVPTFADLPNEMIQSACHFLPTETLSKLSRVNTRLSTVLHHRFAWCRAPLSLVESPIDIPSTSIVAQFAPMTIVWRSTESNDEHVVQEEVQQFQTFGRCEYLHLFQNDSGTALPLSLVLALPNVQLALRELTIHVRWLDPECARFLSALIALQQLSINKEWSNGDDQPTSDATEQSSSASSSRDDTSIQQRRSRNTVQFFNAIARIPNLHVLKIFNSNRSPASSEHLYPLGSCPSLTNLFISGNEGVLNNQQDFMRFLSGNTFRRQLECLTLYRFTLDFGRDQEADRSIQIEELSHSFAALQSLHTLDLARCDGLNWILSRCISQMRSLRHLIIRSRFDAHFLETTLVELDEAHPLEIIQVHFVAIIQFETVQACVDAVNNALRANLKPSERSRVSYEIERSNAPSSSLDVFPPHVLIKRIISNERKANSSESASLSVD